MKPVIVISMGDYNGVGPEVILKAFNQIDLNESQPVVAGCENVFHSYNNIPGKKVNIRSISSVDQIVSESDTLFILNCIDEIKITIKTGTVSSQAGKISMLAVERAVDMCLSGEADALVTAPISKEAIHKAGYRFPGHTEYLADKTGSTDFQMILVHESLRIALATIHEPVRNIAALITKDLLENQIRNLNRSLKDDFGIREPKIAVLGLNPHSGDGGAIGDEEINIIRPALVKAGREKMKIAGPFAADGFFGSSAYHYFDAILAMYHDQGLIPFKTLSFGSGVNFTAGLPIIRTSPDHGTGFDIAGMNKACSQSFIAAYNLAVKMVFNKKITNA